MPASQDIIKQLRSSVFLSVSEAESLITIVLDNADIDTTDRHHSFFFYEIRPIFSVAKYLEADAIKFTDRPDGIIQTGHQYLNVECTRDLNVEDGYQESLRMELLKKDGMVSAFQPIKATGTRANRNFGDNSPRARLIDWKSITEEKARKFYEAFERKNNAPIDNADILIVTFDDMEHPRTKEKFLLPITKFWDEVKNITKFSRVFLIGDSQEFLWDSFKPNCSSLPTVPQ